MQLYNRHTSKEDRNRFIRPLADNEMMMTGHIHAQCGIVRCACQLMSPLPAGEYVVLSIAFNLSIAQMLYEFLVDYVQGQQYLTVGVWQGLQATVDLSLGPAGASMLSLLQDGGGLEPCLTLCQGFVEKSHTAQDHAAALRQAADLRTATPR